MIGERVRLVRTTDPYTELRPGDLGTVDHIDGTGTMFVKWDNGSRLGLIADEDEWEVVDA